MREAAFKPRIDREGQLLTGNSKILTLADAWAIKALTAGLCVIEPAPRSPTAQSR